ncbi:uncharacterized protein [Narcine bancroftii]|uniref:uncharacterized protein n=1 Tax=Narcine bancroftii TaxID=1343680 RepID=UPI0038319A3F
MRLLCVSVSVLFISLCAVTDRAGSSGVRSVARHGVERTYMSEYYSLSERLRNFWERWRAAVREFLSDLNLSNFAQTVVITQRKVRKHEDHNPHHRCLSHLPDHTYGEFPHSGAGCRKWNGHWVNGRPFLRLPGTGQELGQSARSENTVCLPENAGPRDEQGHELLVLQPRQTFWRVQQEGAMMVVEGSRALSLLYPLPVTHPHPVPHLLPASPRPPLSPALLPSHPPLVAQFHPCPPAPPQPCIEGGAPHLP